MEPEATTWYAVEQKEWASLGIIVGGYSTAATIGQPHQLLIGG
jgi:hypothetical protein